MAEVRVPLANSARTIVVTDRLPAIPADYPFVEDLTTEWYFRPEVEGILMGMGATPPPSLDPPLDEAQLEAMIEVAVHRVPVLAQAGLLTAWTGVRPLTPDGQAILGPVAEPEGFWLNAGWGGVGLIQAPVAGQLLAEYLVQGQPATFDVAALLPARFEEPRASGN
jgi:4-methylaminobutanoate oxidase (formaldehyde-forming)